MGLKSVERKPNSYKKGDTDPVRMQRYMETEMVNLPTVQSFKYLGSTKYRGGGASKDVDNRVTKAWLKWRELSGVICDKKIPTKLKLLIYQTVIRPTLLHGCEIWPMSVKDEKRIATTEMRMVRWAMGVSLLEHRRNEEILEEAKVEAIATVMRRRRLEWFGHVKRRGETENVLAVAEMKMEGKRPRGRPKLRWKDTVRRDLKAWKIKEEGPLTEKDGKVSAIPATPNRETAAKGEKGENSLSSSLSSHHSPSSLSSHHSPSS